MGILFANDASSTLQTGVTSGATQIVVATADAGLFPSPSGGSYFLATVVDSSGNMEIMKCTARSGNTLTVARGQEGTTAFAFAVGAIVDLRLTKGTMEALTQVTGESLPTHNHTASQITNLSATTVPFTPVGNIASTSVQAAIAELDAEKANVSALASYAQLSGPTFTGNVQLSLANPTLIINKAASGQSNDIQGKTNGVLRWAMNLGNSSAESANSGSHFQIHRYSDAGSFLDTAVTIERDSGQTWLYGNVILHKPAGSHAIFAVNSNSAATTEHPFLVLRKNGADRLQLAADSANVGFINYSAVGTNAKHQFLTNTGGGDSVKLTIANNGDVTASGNLSGYSDERLKKDWKSLPDDFLKRLAAVKMGTYTRIDTKARQVGVGAQSLRDVLPEAVLDGMTSEEPLSVAYGNAALAAAVALAQEVVALRARIETLEAGAR